MQRTPAGWERERGVQPSTVEWAVSSRATGRNGRMRRMGNLQAIMCQRCWVWPPGWHSSIFPSSPHRSNPGAAARDNSPSPSCSSRRRNQPAARTSLSCTTCGCSRRWWFMISRCACFTSLSVLRGRGRRQAVGGKGTAWAAGCRLHRRQIALHALVEPQRQRTHNTALARPPRSCPAWNAPAAARW